ncbi:MAG TPA: Lsr2 family protein [Propionibacteriaceae bacterium]|nr:Lsr2 family protein [Propionibacteriaceae bacterium]
MVSKMTVVLEDDVDGSPAAETIRFALDGVNYEIDLSSGNAEKLRSAVAPWIGSARRTGGRKAQTRATAPVRNSSNATAIRTWARDHGFEVSDRGRVSAEIRKAYEDAH